MEKSVLYIGNKLSSSKTNPTTHYTLEEGLQAEGFNVISASPLKSKILRLAHMILVFLKNYRKVDYVLLDVYSTQNFWYAVVIGGMSAAFSVKYVPILHGGDLKKRFRRSPKPSYRLLKYAAWIVSPSVYLKKEVEAMGFSGVKYIPNPLVLQKYQFRKRNKFKPKLLWVRAFDKIYNPFLAIKVLKNLKMKYPEAVLCMVGPDKDGSFKECRRYAEENSLKVTFTGKLKKKEWIILAKDYDIFLNTSNIDNTPVSVIEAMALGLPVVSTNIGGLPYLIEDEVCGLLVPPNDSGAMANSIIRIVENPQKAQELANCGRRKIKEFDWQLIKKEWHEILG